MKPEEEFFEKHYGDYEGRREDGFMSEALTDVTEDSLQEWTKPEKIYEKPARMFEGFQIVDGIDNQKYPDREVSLVRVLKGGVYPQHVHEHSDALFRIISGEAEYLSGDLKFHVKAGDTIKIPKGTPHGFEIKEGSTLEFVSIQSPPIKDRQTGEEDFHSANLTDMV